MAIHGRERLRVIKALAEETEYRGGSALRVTHTFNGVGRAYMDDEVPAPDTVRTWVYSYVTPIAAVLNDGTVWHSSRSYSTTTSHHQGLARVYLANLDNTAPWIERL